MNSKRDIFWQDKIYLQVADGESRYNYQSYPVQGSHAFKDGEDVTGRYELERRGTTSKFFDKTFAIPTPAPVADNPDHIFNPVAELPKEATLKAKELVEKFRNAIHLENTRYNKIVEHPVDLKFMSLSAKQCALISINREIDLINRLLATGLNNDFDLLRERGELMEVRTAINQL